MLGIGGDQAASSSTAGVGARDRVARVVEFLHSNRGEHSPAIIYQQTNIDLTNAREQIVLDSLLQNERIVFSRDFSHRFPLFFRYQPVLSEIDCKADIISRLDTIYPRGLPETLLSDAYVGAEHDLKALVDGRLAFSRKHAEKKCEVLFSNRCQKDILPDVDEDLRSRWNEIKLEGDDASSKRQHAANFLVQTHRLDASVREGLSVTLDAEIEARANAARKRRIANRRSGNGSKKRRIHLTNSHSELLKQYPWLKQTGKNDT